MHLRRFLFPFLFASLSLALSGCIYLRLLEVKYQLQTFDGYVKIKNHDGLSLNFLRPVLLEKDLLFLARRYPTKIEESHRGTHWQYLFIKQHGSSEKKRGDFDLPVNLFFQNNKLITVIFPARFSEILPEPFIVAAMRALGRSEISIKGRFAYGAFHNKDSRGQIQIPGKQDVLKLLGRPSEQEYKGDLWVLTYRYHLEPGESDVKKSPALGWARFTFPSTSDNLLKAEARFARVHLSMDFRNGSTDDHRTTAALNGQAPSGPQKFLNSLIPKFLNSSFSFTSLKRSTPP